MVCVLHVATGKNTGIIVPYNVGDYHSSKEHEADLLMKSSDLTELVGAEKCYHVQWTGTPRMKGRQIVSEENFEQQYVKSFEKIDGGDPVTFSVARHGGFTVSGISVGHLDHVARPLWTEQDKRTR